MLLYILDLIRAGLVRAKKLSSLPMSEVDINDPIILGNSSLSTYIVVLPINVIIIML